MAEKLAKPAAKRSGATKTRSRSRAKRRVEHAHVAERAYFIHLDEGSHDDVANWLRAEQELAAS